MRPLGAGKLPSPREVALLRIPEDASNPLANVPQGGVLVISLVAEYMGDPLANILQSNFLAHPGGSSSSLQCRHGGAGRRSASAAEKLTPSMSVRAALRALVVPGLPAAAGATSSLVAWKGEPGPDSVDGVADSNLSKSSCCPAPTATWQAVQKFMLKQSSSLLTTNEFGVIGANCMACGCGSCCGMCVQELRIWRAWVLAPQCAAS
eukprot:CAMPEP_0204206502 /NCGR_PEP_ID=MMETSP0361-20130328/71092_1 /ASSEMBLY_ACC=CAM_ASM_000343 /TAXON_ID=268821 /ORGANISM="Scrippsiella Hangoei, Strain SHTV-5" /LENGTH=206 /DNA_ID=CAMNT_0051169931 /DNA_START=128 /DNA_END=746 /DNA_ORIENTATION=+